MIEIVLKTLKIKVIKNEFSQNFNEFRVRKNPFEKRQDTLL